MNTIILILLFGAKFAVSNQSSSKINYQLFPHLPYNLITNNTKCIQQYQEFLSNLHNQTLWAYQIQDSMASSASGVLSGSSYQMGNFDQCLEAQAPFTTKYCLVEIRAEIQPQISRDKFSLYHDPYENVFDRLYPWDTKNQLKRNLVKLGWCIPASCTKEDLEESLNTYLNESQLDHVNYHGIVDDIFCYKQDDTIEFEIIDFVFVLLLAFLISMVLVCTIYDLKIQQKKSKTILQQICVSFSLNKNLQDLTRADTSDPSMLVFYSIRAYYILMVILMHDYFRFTPLPLLNLDYIEKQYRMPLFQLFMHGDLAIDTFFALGGIMLVYQLLLLSETKSIHPVFIIVKRYFRLTPVYGFVILCTISILDNLGTGPFWKMIIVSEAKYCSENWWTNLLYLNNYINTDHFCLLHTWYLPCDFHYFIIGTITCFIISKNKRIGFIIVTILIMISLLIPTIITWIQSFPAMSVNVPPFLMLPKTNQYFMSIYVKSHTRAGPYFIGMIVGYIYYKQKDINKRLGKVQSWLIIILSIFIMSGSLAGAVVFYNPYYEYNRLEAAIYSGLSRSIFALGNIGILYVASYGFKYLHAILSWKVFIPFSKLVYSVYMVHELFIFLSVGSLRTPRRFTYINLIATSIPHMVASYITALVLYLLIEAPFRRIFNILSMKRKQVPKNNGIVLTDNCRNVGL